MIVNTNNDIKIQFRLKTHDSKKTHVLSQNPVKNAFFIEGGGTRGIYGIGVLKYLQSANPYIKLDQVDIFGGTSVGSYLATALSLGYQKDDLVEITKIIDVRKLIDSKYMFMMTMYRFMTQGHLYDDTGRQDIIKKILDYKIVMIKDHLGIADQANFGGKDLTFSHLKKLIASHPITYKHLLINVVDISKNDQIFMTTLNDEFDDIKLFDAMSASSSIPFVFKPVTMYYHGNTKKYGYQQLDGSTINNLVDGGVSTNNPLDFFLLNDEKYSHYKLWLLKFTNYPQYVKIDSTIILLKQLMEYLITGKNDIKMNLVEEDYHINCINLHSTAGTLDIYTPEAAQKIIDDIYNQCVSGKLFFGNETK